LGPSLGLALRTAFFGLIGWEMARLGTAATLLTVSHAISGEVWAVLLIAPAVASIVLMYFSLREVATALTSRGQGPRA
jgi:hypothetical protein